MGDLRLPVFKAQRTATMVQPGSLSDHVIDAQPDVLIWADGLAGVLVKFVVLLPRQWSAEDTTLGHAGIVGGMEVLLCRV